MAQSNSIILDIQINQEALEQARQKAADLKAQIDGLKTSMDNLSKSGGDSGTALVKMKAEVTNLTKQYNSQVNVLKQVSVVQNIVIGGINNASKASDEATKSTSKVGEETKKTTSALESMGKGFDLLKSAFSSIKTENKTLNAAFEKLSGASDIFSQSFGFMKGMVEKSIVSLKGFKAALASTGIGAVVIALQLLVEHLASTEKGMKVINTVIDYVSATFKILSDKVSVVGDVLGRAFKDPQKAIKDLGNFLVNNLVNRFKALIDLVKSVGKGINALVNRDMDGLKEAASDAGTALIQMNTGLDAEQQKKFADAVRGTAKEIDAQAQALGRLRNAQKQLEASEIASISLQNQLKRSIDDMMDTYNDEKKSINERANALRKANQLQQESIQDELKNAKLRASILEQQIAAGEAESDSKRQQAELNAEIANLEEELRDQKREGETEVTAFLQEEANRQTEIKRQKLEEEKAIEEEYAAIRQQFRDNQRSEYEEKIAELDAYVAKLRKTKEEETSITAFYEKEKARIEKEERERKYAEEEEARQQAHENELTSLQLQFENKKLTEEEYKTAVLEAQQEFLENSIAQIQETLGNPDATTINDAIAPSLTDEEIQERLDKLGELHGQLNTNEQQFAEQQNTIQQEKQQIDEQTTDARLSIAHSYVDAIGDLHGEQAKSNKAYKALQKTLAIADIGVNLAKELGQINANPAVNADVSQTLRATLTGAAIARSIVAIAKVRKMETGGRIESGNELAGFPRSGDNTLILAQPGELILNQRQQSNLGLTPHVLKSAGVPGFATGGFVDGGMSARAITTPVQQAVQEVRETQVPVLVLEDFETKQGTKVKVEDALSI